MADIANACCAMIPKDLEEGTSDYKRFMFDNKNVIRDRLHDWAERIQDDYKIKNTEEFIDVNFEIHDRGIKPGMKPGRYLIGTATWDSQLTQEELQNVMQKKGDELRKEKANG